MKRLTKGKVYFYYSEQPEDDTRIWIVFRVDKVYYRDTDKGRLYSYDITTIKDDSTDELKWSRGDKIDRCFFPPDSDFKEIPESEWTLYYLEDEE